MESNFKKVSSFVFSDQTDFGLKLQHALRGTLTPSQHVATATMLKVLKTHTHTQKMQGSIA